MFNIGYKELVSLFNNILFIFIFLYIVLNYLRDRGIIILIIKLMIGIYGCLILL